MKALVVGDSYTPVEVFRRALERLNGNHRLEYLQVGIQRTEVDASPSGQRIREYVGSPGRIIGRLSDRDGPVVHAAAATDAVLNASQLKLVCCAPRSRRSTPARRWWRPRRSSALRPEAGSST